MSIFELKGFDSIFDSTLSSDLTDGLVEFFNWGLLQKGNYFTASLDEVNSSLSSTDGNIWSAPTKGWVWEPGIAYDEAPNYVSGVYVDDEFYPLNTVGDHSYNIDYYNGNVVFDSGLPLTSEVKVEHSYKWINVEYADMNKIKHFVEDDNISKELKVSLPNIAIEVVAKDKFKGYQLGGGQIIDHSILIHCLADNSIVGERLADLVSFQNDKTVFLFDSNRIAASGDFPTDYRGFLKENPKNYRQLVEEYPGYRLRLQNVSTFQIETKNSSLYGNTVKFDGEIVKLDI